MGNWERLSWKKKIKYVQIAILLLLVVLYFVRGFFNKQKQYFENEKNMLQKKEIALTTLQAEKNKIDLISQRVEKIINNSGAFIQAYNVCYTKYIKNQYSLSDERKIVSLKDCIYDKGFKKPFIKNLTDIDIEKIAIGLGVLKNNNLKLSYPQTEVLYSLDKNIFYDKMENTVQMISFGIPKIIDKSLNLYAVDFSLKTEVNYSTFKNMLNAFQNKIYLNKPVYYSIKSISSFDISKINDLQPLLVQGEFYFTK